MTQKYLLIFVTVLTFLFLIIFDQTQRYYVDSFFIALAPIKEVEVFPVESENVSVFEFSKDFIFGISSSAYQVEGAWNEDGKTPSTWDTYVHNHPELIADGSNADVGSDSYYLFDDDIDILNSVGFKHYRFSIAWTRILPNGSAINQKGIDHYREIIDKLIANNIEPIVTIFHWDLPQWLQDLGGLTNPIFVEYYKAYTDVLFNAFGDKVKTWITVNEPFVYCTNSYGLGKWAPGIKSPGVGDYLCGHHLLMAHSAAYHLYHDKYFEKFGGKVGITLESPYFFPKDSSVTAEEHQRAMLFRIGWFAQPIFGKEGGYPQVMIDDIGKRSAVEGRPFSRFPTMSEELKKSIQGSSDFFGINFYTNALVELDKRERDPREEPSWLKDSRILESIDYSWKLGMSLYLVNVPQGLRELLKWIKKEYDNPSVFITENGWADDGRMEDDGRIDYLNSHLTAVATAIKEDKCNVIGYIAWSLIESFEWNRGYTIKYGLFHVNHTSPKKERTPKKSVGFLRNVIKSRSVVEHKIKK